MSDSPIRKPIVYVYTFGRDTDRQRGQLEVLAASHGWHIFETHADTQASRPELKRLQAAIMAGKVDLIMVHALADLGAGLAEMIETAAWIQAQGVHLWSINPPIDSSSKAGRALMDLIGYLADVHSDKRRERQRSSPPKKPPGGARRK
jgi:DNA invertase Pin-like site-specific DNA recombinase